MLHHMLIGLVPAEMEVGAKFLEILQVEFKPAYKHSGVQLGGCFIGMPKPLNNIICAILVFENSMMHIEF